MACPGGAVVEMSRVTGVVPVLEGEMGLKLQTAPCGRPEHSCAMMPGTLAFTVKVNVPAWPRFTVALLVPGVMVMKVLMVTVAVAAFPVPPLVEVTLPVVLTCAPPPMAITLTAKLQEPAAGRVAPPRVTEPEPAVAVMVPPPQ